MDLFALTATLKLDTTEYEQGLTGATGMLDGLGGVAGKAGNVLKTAFKYGSSAVVNFGKDVLETGMGFDKQMSSVQSVLGQAEGTVENMTKLRGYALDTARDSIFTAEQTGEAYYYMGLAGWKSEQMLAGLPGVMNLAAASGEDLGLVSDIVTDSITAFGLTANDVSGYVDLLAQTVTNSNTDVADLGTAFKYAAPVAGALGLSVDDVALSLGLMANAGVKGSQAGTSMRQMFTRLANDTNGARKTLDALGVSVFDNAGNMRDWGDIIADSRTAWKGLTKEQQANYATTIAGQRGMSGWLAMMNTTDDEYAKLATSIELADNAAKTMADTRLDNLWGDLQLLNSSFDVLKIAIFDDVKGPLREVVQDATAGLDRIREAIEEGGLEGGIKQLGIEIEGFGKKLEPLLKSAGKALAPLITGLLDGVAPAAAEAAVTVGASLGAGILQGLEDAIANSDGVLSKVLGLLIGTNPAAQGAMDAAGVKKSGLSSVLGAIINPVGTSGMSLIGALGGGEQQPQTVEVDVVPKMKAGAINEAIDEAMASGQASVEIDGENVSLFEASKIAAEVEAGLRDVDTVAGQPIADAIGTSLSGVDTGGMESAIESAGSTAGSSVASQISSAISGQSYSINVHANVTGLPSGGGDGGGTEKHAKSMFGGTILRGATIFGTNADGAPLLGGEAGPEAIVGVGSLASMIRQFVGEAVASTSGSARDVGNAMQASVDAGFQTYGPAMSDDIVSKVSAIVTRAVNRVANRPVHVTVNGNSWARGGASYNAKAARAYADRIAAGFGGK